MLYPKQLSVAATFTPQPLCDPQILVWHPDALGVLELKIFPIVAMNDNAYIASFLSFQQGLEELPII